MTNVDRHGNVLSANDDAVRPYVEAVDCVLSARTGAEQLLRRAIEADPSFVLARWLLASVRQEAGDAAEASALRKACLEEASALSARERDHVVALGELMARGTKAMPLVEAYVAAHPRDLLFLEEAGRYLFFFGGRGKRARIRALYESVAPSHGEDWAYLGRFAFHLVEGGDPRAARMMAERALELRPDNGHAAHALAHALYELGAWKELRPFLDAWLARSGYEGRLRAHLFWHVAVLQIDAGEWEDALRTYEAHVVEEGAVFGPLALADAVGFLWRLRLHGKPASFEDVASRARALAGAGKARPFVDAHTALALAGVGDADAIVALTTSAGRDESTAALGRALASYARGDWTSAAATLEPLGEDLYEFVGGSNVERSLLGDTLLDAMVRSGSDAARAKLEARVAVWPSAGFVETLTKLGTS